MTRFDPWQNRPDQRTARPRLRPAGARRNHLLVWLAVFAALVAGYTFREEIGTTEWRSLGLEGHADGGVYS